MSDDELLRRICLGINYLIAHGRLDQGDDIAELAARYIKVKAERTPGPISSGEHQAVIAALDRCMDQRDRLMADLEAARTPGPDVSRLLAAAKGVETLAGLAMLETPEGIPGRKVAEQRVTELIAAIAEHEAATKRESTHAE